MSSLPLRVSGALSAQYRLEQEIGAGGMATVYLAEDLRHDRRVAVKVLRPELAAVIGAERFLAEIKLTANLQHPHILPLFDSGEADSFLYYVMPFVEGESLRDRLTREKQLPVDDAVRIACEVASALDYAHRHRVIHRDIKPENILLHDGRALVADFGIALAASQAGTRMTETGMSLGTPHYMSPEQAMGEREITARSDVYALGAVLYEMLTGDPPFTGSTAQAIVARVVTESPRPLLPQRHTIPPHVESAVLTALEKLPADRFATAAQFADALTTPGVTRQVTSRTIPLVAASRGSARARLRDPLTIGLAVLAAAGLGLAGTLMWRSRPESSVPTVRFLYTGSDSATVASDWAPWPAAISPDGSLLVYPVSQPGGTDILYVRRADQLEGHAIPGTNNGNQPLFSPDGRWIAFEANNVDKKVRLDGSAPVRIATGGADNGADWTTSDELVIGSGISAHGLSKVSVAGGDLVPFTAPDSAHGEFDHLWPIGTPDGRSVVFVIWHGALPTSELAMVSLDGGPVVRLGLKAIRPLAVVDDALVYVLADGAVMAVPLDVVHRRVTGKPVPVLDPVPVIGAFNGNSAVFVSRGGALVTGLEAARSQLMWVGRDGTSRPVSRELRSFDSPRISPDGRHIAVLVTDGPKTDIWVDDLETGTLSRLTSSGNMTIAEWSRDGRSVIYAAPGNGSNWAVWRQSLGGGTTPELLVEQPLLAPVADLAPDGHTVLLQTLTASTWDLQSMRVDSTRALKPFNVTPASDLDPRFSPDGRWAALTTDESGAFEVYVRSYPEPTVKIQVSVGGGAGAMWSADGTRLYYSVGNAIVEARLATSPDLRVLSRDTAFSGVPHSGGSANYDITRDGSRLVLPRTRSTAYPLVVVPNWRTELRERMAANRK
ncbi:MAG TPA: protein kinase [Gemmatimonadales bacterium]|jgi:serine/threonine-protein kinase|nr:protein kinase [Gemmatimonadales bacterium]